MSFLGRPAGAGVGGITFPFSAWNIIGDAVALSNAQGQININSDGSITRVGTTASSGVDGTNWFTPPSTGIGSGYWVRITVTAGAFSTSSGTGSWIALSGNWTGEVHNTTGTSSCTFTIEIATDAAGANIVLTSTGNIIKYQHTL